MMMMMMKLNHNNNSLAMIAILFILVATKITTTTVLAFAPPTTATATATLSTTTCLSMSSDDEDMMREARASRSAGANDRLVELKRPLGLILDEDEVTGNVYVKTVAPKGNAARTGMVKEGDLVTMCSATFGDQMWSTRGVGLTRVMSAIRVRAGPTVKLVFENPKDSAKRAVFSKKQAQAAEKARMQAQQKKDSLLKQLQKDEEKLGGKSAGGKKKFFGLF